jgi:hypothetical protein
MKSEIAFLTKEKEEGKLLKQQVKSFSDTLQKVKEKEVKNVFSFSSQARIESSFFFKGQIVELDCVYRPEARCYRHQNIESI